MHNLEDSTAEIAQLRNSIAQRDARIRELERLVDYLTRKPYRPSSEALEFMTSLFDEAEADDHDPPPTDESPITKVNGHKRRRGIRRPIPSNLPRQTIRYEIPGESRHCSCCGGGLHEIGVEVTEQIDIIPQKVQVLSHQRVKYGCRSCEATVVIADMPVQPIPKSMASASTLAHIAVAKYADHLPLYRQESMWSRLGIDLDRGTLAQWMVKVGKLVQPIINLMIEDVKKDGVVSIDETTVQVLREKEKKATSPGYMWVMTRAGPGPSITVFEYDKSRSGRVAERLLDDFKGTIVTDGFDGYKRLAFKGITRAACWAHARRKFFEAAEIEGKNTDDTVAKRALVLIRKMYDVERETAEVTAQDRLAARGSLTKPVMREIEQLLDNSLPNVPPKSPTGRALRYLRDEWDALQVFLRDGRVPIDNNRVENAIRPFAVGRKNWLFSSSPAGARSSANIFTLIETAKANNIEPYAYLTRVFDSLPNAVTQADIEALLPYRS